MGRSLWAGGTRCTNRFLNKAPGGGIRKRLDRSSELKHTCDLMKGLPEDKEECVLTPVGRGCETGVAHGQGQQQQKQEAVGVWRGPGGIHGDHAPEAWRDSNLPCLSPDSRIYPVGSETSCGSGQRGSTTDESYCRMVARTRS